MNKSTRVFVFKIVVTILILGLLFAAVDVRTMVDHTKEVSIIAFVLAAFFYIVATVVSTVRWSLLLRVRDITLPFARLVAYNLSYTFYSIVLPGGKVAAEGVRLYQVVRDSSDETMRSRIVFPTLLDRALVVFSAAGIATVFFLVLGFESFTALPTWFPYAAAGLMVILFLATFLPIENLIGRVLGVSMGTKQSAFTNLREAFTLYRNNTSALLVGVAISVLMLITLALAIQSIAVSLAVEVSFLLILGIVSASMAAAFLPLTIGGIGVREGVFAYLFSTAAGVSLELALSISILALFSSHVVTVLGGVVELYRNFLRKHHV